MTRLHDQLKMTQTFNSNIWIAPDLAIICFRTKSFRMGTSFPVVLDGLRINAEESCKLLE